MSEWVQGYAGAGLGVARNELGHVNHPSSCMHYTPSFCGCHFLPILPLGTCLNPRFIGVYDAKYGKAKYARVFMQKKQCSC